MNFYFDQHVPLAVAHALMRRNIDVLTTQQAGRCGESDLGQLEFATVQGRVLVTFDQDYLRIAAKGFHHSGIAYSSTSRYSIGELVYALLLLHDVLEAADMVDHVEFLLRSHRNGFQQRRRHYSPTHSGDEQARC